MRRDSWKPGLARAGVAGVAAGVALLGTALPAAAAGHGSDGSAGPPGNNGTVKIHEVGVTGNANDPHVGCDFQVDYFGFDAGQSLTAVFAGQAPTDSPGSDDLQQAGALTLQDGSANPVTTDGDANGNDGDRHDATQVWSADAGALQQALGDPQSQQGYHVKLTVRTGEPGAHAVKHKVFWLDCVVPAGTGPTATGPSGGQVGSTSSSTTTGGQQTVVSGISGSQPAASQVTGNAVTAPTSTAATTVSGTTAAAAVPAAVAASTTPTQVLGEKFTRTAPTQVSAAGGSLPFTGARDVGLLAGAGAAALGGGWLLLAGSRRRRTTS